MPIYEYQCQECAHKLEKLQRMSDDPLTDCPACGKPALKRLVSAAGFRLKGGGWYETDFKQGNQRNLAGADSDSKSGEGGKTDDKSKASGKKTSDSGASASKGTSNSAGGTKDSGKKPATA